MSSNKQVGYCPKNEDTPSVWLLKNSITTKGQLSVALRSWNRVSIYLTVIEQRPNIIFESV